MEENIKKFFIYVLGHFTLLISIWLIIVLFVNKDTIFSFILSIISLIPCAFYIFYGVKLLSLLEIEKFYYRI